MDSFSSFDLFRRRVDQMFADFDQQMFGGGDIFGSPFMNQQRIGGGQQQQQQGRIGHEKPTGLSSNASSTPSRDKEEQERVIPLQGGSSGASGGGQSGSDPNSRSLTTRPSGGPLGFWGGAGWPSPATLPSMKLDLIEEKDRYLINADVPGFNKEQIKLNIKDGLLTVSGETSSSKEEDDPDRKYHRVERSSGSIYRTVRLPDYIKEDQVSASCDNGVLKVVLPKDKPREQQRERSIQVS